ncbi:MAG: hypothetical protein ACRYFX_15350 [Janthinobacterium lividum]
MKAYRVEYVQLAGWKAGKVGLWLAENEEWVLLREIPVDYVVDGYVLLAKEHILSRKPKRGRKQVEQVLQLKGIKAELPPKFTFLETVEMLRWVEQQYGLVEFTDQEDCAFFGWVNEADAVHFWIDSLTPKGTVDLCTTKDKPYVLSEIQTISFGADYFNSLKLIWQHKQRRKLLKPSDN